MGAGSAGDGPVLLPDRRRRRSAAFRARRRTPGSLPLVPVVKIQEQDNGVKGLKKSISALKTHANQEPDVIGGEFESLDFAQLVLRESRDDLPQPEEGVVQHLSPLSLPHVCLGSTVTVRGLGGGWRLRRTLHSTTHGYVLCFR